MHQRGDEFRQPAEVMLERDSLIRFAAEQDLVAIHHVECRKGNGIHTAPALLLQHGSFHAIHGEQAHSDSEQDQRPGDEQYQFVLCGQDHRSSQGWLPRARARLAGSPRSGVLCLTSFSSGRNTRCAPGKETPLIFRSTPMHGKGRIQKHGLRNTLESIVPAHKCQTVMIPCPAFWNPMSVFSVLLFFLFPFAAGWLGKRSQGNRAIPVFQEHFGLIGRAVAPQGNLWHHRNPFRKRRRSSRESDVRPSRETAPEGPVPAH